MKNAEETLSDVEDIVRKSEINQYSKRIGNRKEKIWQSSTC